MRALRRNYNYTVYISDIESMDGVDAYGNPGSPIYGDPVAFRANVAPNDGTSSYFGYGKDENYQRTINLLRTYGNDVKIPSEHARVWLDADPDTEQHDYVIRGIKPYVNLIAVQLRKVNGNE